MDNDTAHTLSEFRDFPWEKLDDTWFSSCGGIGHGGVIAGVDFNPFRPHISFIRDDISADVWELPEQLARLLEAYRERGRDEIAGQLRNLIGASRG